VLASLTPPQPPPNPASAANDRLAMAAISPAVSTRLVNRNSSISNGEPGDVVSCWPTVNGTAEVQVGDTIVPEFENTPLM
jgi:hypothetical protein